MVITQQAEQRGPEEKSYPKLITIPLWIQRLEWGNLIIAQCVPGDHGGRSLTDYFIWSVLFSVGSIAVDPERDVRKEVSPVISILKNVFS